VTRLEVARPPIEGLRHAVDDLAAQAGGHGQLAAEVQATPPVRAQPLDQIAGQGDHGRLGLPAPSRDVGRLVHQARRVVDADRPDSAQVGGREILVGDAVEAVVQRIAERHVGRHLCRAGAVVPRAPRPTTMAATHRSARRALTVAVLAWPC